MVLYGRPGRVVTDHLQLIWTPLLSDAALQTVEAIGVCQWQPDPPNRLFFYPYSIRSNPFGSLWKRPLLPVDPAPSYSWVEVSHCAKQTNISSKSLPWFYFAHGSGVSLNVGRTAAIDLRARPPHCNVRGDGAPSIGALREKLRKCVDDVDALDSIQLLHELDGYSDEERSVVILLSTELLSETQSLTHAMRVGLNGSPVANTSVRLMCGRWPDLFPCNDSNPAIDYMSRCSSITLPLLEHAMRPCGRVRQPLPPPPLPPPASVPPPSQQQIFAWFHPPKTGTSFGTALAHTANVSLPQCARMSACTLAPHAPSGKELSLKHPYVPHKCNRASDYFMVRFPPKDWFRNINFWPAADDGWGSHEIVDSRTFQRFSGFFYGMFRQPGQLILSNYFRMLGHGASHVRQCLSRLGMKLPPPQLQSSGDDSMVSMLYHNFSTVDGIAVQALLMYAQHRQGHVTRLLAGQGDHSSAGSNCPGSGQEIPNITLALERLKGFRFTGLTDNWERSICLLHVMHGSHPCAAAELLNSRPTVSTDYDSHALSVLDNFQDTADSKLYAAAQSRFEEDLAKWKITESVCKELRCTFDSWSDSSLCGQSDTQPPVASVPPPQLVARTPTLKSIYWLHIPKTSTLFATTALTYACGESVVSAEATSSLTRTGPPILKNDCQGRLSHKQCCSAAPSNHTKWFHDPLPWPEVGLPNVGNVVMLLREPRQRILSAYFYLRATNGKCCGKGWGWSAPSSYSAFRAAALHADSTTFLALPGASGCQTKMLVGRGCMDSVAVTSQEVSRAVSFILHTAAFVGIVEEYNASVCLWHERFGGSIVSSEEVAIQLSSSLHPPYDTSPASMGGFVDRADEQTYNAGVLRFHLELSKTHKCGQVAQRRSLRSLAL